ncbi:medium chain dehydrogenase/reductase family protein [Amycolatopsis nigrescens]|uniref:medium chain dehydrogenase/reductase family protein n=1 Tax=Amycolatopsis nigrescens TaxID=381445 RepID=UPI000371BF91|nr:medium chain dehydrogenase/reductase family protein [Amycolatopsis nigrescens]
MRYQHVNVARSGGLETMELTISDTGPVKPGEVIVRVEAAGISYGDILHRLGVIPGSVKPPFTPGYDLAGVVEEVGAGVQGLEAGQPVAAVVNTGGYAERIALPAERVVPMPAGVDAVTAVAAGLNYFIAYQMLHRVAAAKPGQRVLVHGASGGVGLAFLQLAELAGIECWGSASTKNQHIIEKYNGHPIDYQREDFVQIIRGLPEKKVYAAFDAIGGFHFHRSYSLLEKGGILVAYGQSAALVDGKPKAAVGAWGFLGGIAFPKLIPDGRRTTFYNAWALEKSHPQAYREDLGKVLSLLAEGQIEPMIAKTVPLSEAVTAQRDLESGAVTGKIVVTTE